MELAKELEFAGHPAALKLAGEIRYKLKVREKTYVCEGCGETFPQNQYYKPRKVCSGRCRARAFRKQIDERYEYV